jgi:hypothetical protein
MGERVATAIIDVHEVDSVGVNDNKILTCRFSGWTELAWRVS